MILLVDSSNAHLELGKEEENTDIMADRKASTKIPVHKRVTSDHKDDLVVATPPAYPEVITLHDHIKKNQEPEVSPISPSQYTETEYPSMPRFYPAPQVYINNDTPTPDKEVRGGLDHMSTRYAWHNVRIFIRAASLLLMMLCVFLTIGFGAEQACGLKFSCEWTVTMVTVVSHTSRLSPYLFHLLFWP